MNVFDIAMEKELEVKVYYEKLAGESALPGITNIFTLLAADEQRHFEAVQKMRRKIDCDNPADSPALDAARKVLEKYFGDMGPAAQMKNCLESYRHALLIESESIRFYEGILKTEADTQLKTVVATILDQEREHYSIVENLYEYVLKPEYFLAWAEFSNLREL
ncbi:MAG: ferritin family protein [Geobacteraceae bacterium]|nr:ferritin family protein [Geobacteraceae bacterium]